MAQQWETYHPMVGKRIEMHPATNLWMMGDRYGMIVGVKNAWYMGDEKREQREMVRVNLDKSGRYITTTYDNIQLI